MQDPRLQKLARVLIHYSLQVKPGDKLYITAPETAAPLVQAAYEEAIRTGAHVKTRLGLSGLSEIFLRQASEEQLAYQWAVDQMDYDQMDALLQIMAEPNTKGLSGIDPKRMAMYQAARSPLLKTMLDRSARGDMRWCLTLFPTNAYAQDAGMSLADYEEFVFGAELLDQDDPAAGWTRVRQDQQHIADFLAQHNEIHIVAPGTDITYRVDGRTWINCYGDANFPDGEVFTGPLELSANGTVRFTYPAIFNTREVEDVRLTFRDGKVVEATAARGLDYLNAMLDLDAGSRFLGEVAFGLNYGIKQFSRNILFDEKIGGTMHMALGQSIPESGGKNESALHWDMICDLREGRVFADGQLCYEAGRFTI